MSRYLGLAKTMFNSGVSRIEISKNEIDLEVLLTERFDYQKYSGAWPSKVIEHLLQRHNDIKTYRIFENRDVQNPLEKEEMNNLHYPFFEFLEKKNLKEFSKKFNPNIKYIGHHLCHAYASILFSPFETCLIMVVDASGSAIRDLESDQKISLLNSDPNLTYECYSLYEWKNGKIKLLEKKYHHYAASKHPNLKFSNGLGSMYEKIAQFVFNDPTASGKVMGLAAFGKVLNHQGDHFDFLNSLDWSKAFKGKGKKEWQSHPHIEYLKDVAATAQKKFEVEWFEMGIDAKKKYPEHDNLILAGGCALNCTANWKLFSRKIFKNIYVAPFPGDESISIGLAASEIIESNSNKFKMKQISFWGSKQSSPREDEVLELEKEYQVVRPENIESYCADLLEKGHVIGWFQGRSEVGPRALGHRSILCRADTSRAKDHLNKYVKYREDFRPYGSSIIFEHAKRIFEIPPNFDNSFMSFAVPVRGAWHDLLSDIVHADGTCRMQTIKQEQDSRYYSLLKEMEKRTGLALLLNTSLNIMGQPILESAQELKLFLKEMNLTGVAYGDVFIFSKKSHEAPLLKNGGES